MSTDTAPRAIIRHDPLSSWPGSPQRRRPVRVEYPVRCGTFDLPVSDTDTDTDADVRRVLLIIDDEAKRRGLTVTEPVVLHSLVRDDVDCGYWVTVAMRDEQQDAYESGLVVARGALWTELHDTVAEAFELEGADGGAPATAADPLSAVRSILAERKASLAAGPRTQRELASIVGVEVSVLHKALAGKRPLTGEMVARIAVALGVAPGGIVG